MEALGRAMRRPGRVAVPVPLDFAPGKIGSVPGVAEGLQGRAIEEGPVVEMQDENRGFGGRLVDFSQGGHAPLRELKLGPASDHAHPLGRRGALRPVPEQGQGVGQGRARRPSAVPCCS